MIDQTDEDTLDALEKRTDSRLKNARRHGLHVYWGRPTDGEDYFLYVGHRIGWLGVQNDIHVEVPLGGLITLSANSFISCDGAVLVVWPAAPAVSKNAPQRGRNADPSALCIIVRPLLSQRPNTPRTIRLQALAQHWRFKRWGEAIHCASMPPRKRARRPQECLSTRQPRSATEFGATEVT